MHIHAICEAHGTWLISPMIVEKAGYLFVGEGGR